MTWREREHTAPKISKEELEKRYIKEELMRYDMYIGRVIDIKRDLIKFEAEYDERLNTPNTGGSIIKTPDSSVSRCNHAMALIRQQNSMEENLKYYENKLDALDEWLAYITPSQCNVVKTYVVEYQCQQRHIVAALLKYSEDTIKKHTERAINRIYNNFAKII